MKHNLSTLSLLHYVYGGLLCFAGLCMLLFVAFGHFFSSDWFLRHAQEPPPPFLGSLFKWLGWGLFAFLVVKGVLNFISARMIQQRRGAMFSRVVAVFDCLNIPVGMALGIFTFIALNDEEVKREYARNVSQA